MKEIYIFYGRIQEWTKMLPDQSRKIQSICGRALLIQGLCQMDYGDILPKAVDRQSLEQEIEYGSHGKPEFRDKKQICFNISHSGGYAACGIGQVPCGLDIQEERDFRSTRLLTRTMNEREQKQILRAQDPKKEFCRLWAYKESCLKLTGEGITRSMKELLEPEWHEEFQIGSHILGAVSAGEICRTVYQELLPEYMDEKTKSFLESCI